MYRLKFGVVAVAASLVVTATVAFADTNSSPLTAAAPTQEELWAQHVVQSYQQLQDQQAQTLKAIQQARDENAATAKAMEDARAATDAASKRNSEAVEARLKQVEDQVTVQRQQEVEALQESHRFTLTVVSVFAGIGFGGMLLFGLFLLRAMNRRTELVLAHAAGVPLGQGRQAAGVLAAGDTQLVTPDPAQQVSARFLSTIERLEKRMMELESTATPETEPASHTRSAAPAGAESSPGPVAEPAQASPSNPDAERAARVALLLGKGQALLNLQQADTALTCFDEVSAIDPTNAEAFVKKGTALEKLGKLDEAIDCYDRAIALDTSMTMAYLSKGGVFNRLERYGEALQCYEQALRAQQKAELS
jgi:tetratricopeptide (TPR) repeat protein